ncbi:MAG: DUF3299 domain-containing protein [Bryobacterales bacterium]|nr:DUF3299 domain-containing protein [Bryobacterales bacterium]
MKFVHGVILALMFSVMVYVVNRDMARQDFSSESQPASPAGLVQAAYAAEEPAAKMDWRMLRELNYRTGKISPSLKALDGKTVKIPGYMVPLEDDSEIVSEFLLVPYVGACIHTPPPPPNQIVQVKMNSQKKVKMSFWDPVWVQGKLQIATVKSPYGDVGFQLTGMQIEPYKDE